MQRVNRSYPIGLLLAGLLSASAALASKPDVVIERSEQHWTLGADGRITEHVKLHVQLNHPRGYGEFADYRIAYDAANQDLEILTARTRLPDGGYRELPDYGHVQVSPNASAGWPALASIRQHVLVMSGVMPGCVLEIEYRLRTRPGTRQYLAIDERLDAPHPIDYREVTITVPPGTALVAHARVGADAAAVEPRSIVEGNTARFIARDLPALPDEPHAPAWQQAGQRLVATTATPERWLRQRLAAIDTAGQVTSNIQAAAEEWTADATTPEQQLAALCAGLNERYREVDVPAAWRPDARRSPPATSVLARTYGLPADSGALLLALARALELEAQPALLAPLAVYDAVAPQESMVTACPIVVRVGDAWQVWDATRGRIERDARWGGHLVIHQTDAGFGRLLLLPWTDHTESRCAVTGRLALADGELSGTLQVDQSGLFVSLPALQAEGDQRAHLRSLLAHVLPGLRIDDFTVRQLGAGEFSAALDVSTAGGVDDLHGAWQVAFAERGPEVTALDLPLENGTRQRPFELAGPCRVLVDLQLTWPADTEVLARPKALPRVTGAWGLARQTVTPHDNGLRYQRELQIDQAVLPAETYVALRDELNKLRAAAARTLLLQPAE